MNQLPVYPLTPKQQEQFLQQLYVLMGKQVQSYHKHHHMGSNSSVPTELAQELLESIDYTVHQAADAHTYENAEEALRLGQAILEEKLTKAQSILRLVNTTAPNWQTECRRDALRDLRHYLAAYDHLHLAHQGPDGLFYPVPVAPPADIRGIDSCLFYLNILWIENQIMSAFPNDTLESFWDRLPAGTLNQCEHLLINAIGKMLIRADLTAITFAPEEYLRLFLAMSQATEETLHTAATLLCQKLDLKDETSEIYARSMISHLTQHIGPSTTIERIDNLFL